MRVVEREEVRSIAYLVGQDGSLLVSSAATPHQSNPKPIACVNESLGCVFEYSNQHGEKGLSPGNCGRPSSQGQTKYLMKHNSTWDYHGMNENGYALFEIYSPVSKRNSFFTQASNFTFAASNFSHQGCAVAGVVKSAMVVASSIWAANCKRKRHVQPRSRDKGSFMRSIPSGSLCD